jgi:hypothetical protein
MLTRSRNRIISGGAGTVSFLAEQEPHHFWRSRNRIILAEKEPYHFWRSRNRIIVVEQELHHFGGAGTVSLWWSLPKAMQSGLSLI